MQVRQAASPSPDAPAQAANLLASSPHPEDAEASAGATAGGNDDAGGIAGWSGATGLVESLLLLVVVVFAAGSEYGQPPKQADPQRHVSKASMDGPHRVLAQLYSHASIRSQMAAVSSPHVGGPAAVPPPPNAASR
jgi:hypothetical protein